MFGIKYRVIMLARRYPRIMRGPVAVIRRLQGFNRFVQRRLLGTALVDRATAVPFRQPLPTTLEQLDPSARRLADLLRAAPDTSRDAS